MQSVNGKTIRSRFVMREKSTMAEKLMKKTAEKLAGDNDTPRLRKYFGDDEVDQWNRDFATSDIRDPDGEE